MMNYALIVKVYLVVGQHCDNWLYRKIGILGIDIYQTCISRLHSRECQFRISCSQFLKKQLLEVDDFKCLALNMSRRTIDCSQPLFSSYSYKTGLSAEGPSGNKYSEEELSESFITRIKNRARQVT